MVLCLETSNGCAMQKCVFKQKQQIPRSACAYAQSDRRLHCLLKEALDTTGSINGKQKPERYFAHTKDHLSLCILRTLECTISLDAAQMSITFKLDFKET